MAACALTPTQPLSQPSIRARRTLASRLGAFAVAAIAAVTLSMAGAPRAEALSPVSAGAASPNRQAAAERLIQVRGGHGGGGGHHGGGFHGGGGFRGGGFHGGGFRPAFHGGGYRGGHVYHRHFYGGPRFGGHRPYGFRRHVRPRFYGYYGPRYYGYAPYYAPRRYCRLVYTYYGPRRVCHVRPWRHHWRHHRAWRVYW